MRFLILFSTFAGLALAGTIKEDLLARLKAVESHLNNGSVEYTRHGFDYFTEQIESYRTQVQAHEKNVQLLPDTATEKDAAQLVKDVADVEKNFGDVIQFPSPKELFKTGALYQATIQGLAHGSAGVEEQKLLKQVSDIITVEDHVKALKSQKPVNDPERLKVAEDLKQKYTTLKNSLKKSGVPSPIDFQKLEIAANKKIEQLNKENKHEQEKFTQVVLNKFLQATYLLGKFIPIDSTTRYNQFLATAPGQYQDYKILNSIIFNDAFSK